MRGKQRLEPSSIPVDKGNLSENTASQPSGSQSSSSPPTKPHTTAVIYTTKKTSPSLSSRLSSSRLSPVQRSSSLPHTNKPQMLEKCRLDPKDFRGQINISMKAPSIAEMEQKFDKLKPGGHNIPQGCRADRMAIIVPFRDRDEHLRIMLNNLHPFLMKQKLDYAIIVVEQVRDQTFNRAKLLNVGFVEAAKMYKWECYLFHDVDLLPENDRNLHKCPAKNPRHMAVAMDKFGYKLAYENMFGTSSALTDEQFREVNGFSNRYWGWGGEDDDMFTRIKEAGYLIDRYNTSIARYKMIRHGRDDGNEVNPCRFKLLSHTKKDWQKDGLNTLAYRIVNITVKKLYTHIMVDLVESKEKPAVHRHFCAR
ncbi:hypothetical protein Q1695_003614 [Nippostrongylus brasiliensis]|nr:hypothetical protein Q1695_003614 [Nippostrongylus brasiliensis]